MKTATEFLVIQEEVRDALASGQAVVALESTIIAHGMPYPQNVETAKQVEAVVRAQGAVPATIAVLGGKICIGLSEEQLQHLGQSGHVMKVSRRDLPYVVSQGLDGATTVSATMIGAGLAGVSVFVTGGIGGVHRGAQETFDISADLTELARTKVAVVCAGAKSILDIGLTLEYLETQGVPVIGYGTDDFPAFYARSSGFKADCRLDSPEEVAALLRAKWALGLEGGAVVANPIPEAQAMAWEPIEAATQQALAEASEQGVSGKRLTPFLLARIKSLTGGESLEANIALVKNNAAVGGQLAVALAKLG